MTHQYALKPIVTRFAPSPTGDLHIGGARTALFNYLFAKHNNGKFLLRIEDTDRARSTPQAVGAILDGLNWLGLNADEEPIFQFTRAGRHAEVAHDLVKSGRAFKCYANEEEINAAREAAMAAGYALRSPWRDEAETNSNLPFVVRLRAPDFDDEVIVDDKVQGEVKTMGRQIDDMVLLRSDGTPTYMLAVVVDDYDMGVTHIIRGDDHLTNAARQIVLIEALNWERPIYAHIPLIHGDDGKKLSKRHGALAAHEYKNMGYLPEALLAYLLRLGWSKGDLDIVPIDEAIKIFELKDLGKSPSRLDFSKMDQVNAHFIKLADNNRLVDLMIELSNHKIETIHMQRIVGALPDLKERGKTILELIDQSEYLWTKTPIKMNDKAISLISGDAQNILKQAHALLCAVQHWDRQELKNMLEDLAQMRGCGLGKIGPNIRAALTGGLVAPDLAVTMETLGKAEVLLRLEQAQN